MSVFANAVLNPMQFVEGIQDGRSGVYDRSGGETPDAEKLVQLVDGQAVELFANAVFFLIPILVEKPDKELFHSHLAHAVDVKAGQLLFGLI